MAEPETETEKSNLSDEQVKRNEEVEEAGPEGRDAPMKAVDPGIAREQEHSSRPTE